MEREIVVPEGTLKLTVAAATDVGKVRRANEDSLLAEAPVFLVADGMGGHSFGDRASQSVVATFSSLGVDDGLLSPETIVETIHRANDEVIALREDGDEETVSGTTLAGFALVAAHASRHWMAFNVGDSRVYSWDGRLLTQLTVDHSAVQEMIDSGQISALEAIDHPYRNVVTRAIGVYEAVDPDVWLLPIAGRQTFIACSDGLTKELADDQIAQILAEGAPLGDEQSLADRLVAAALAAGGRDNVTVVLVESELVGADVADPEATSDRAMPGHLEETRPRK